MLENAMIGPSRGIRKSLRNVWRSPETSELGSSLFNLLILAFLDLSTHSRGRMLSRQAAGHALSGEGRAALIVTAALCLIIQPISAGGELFGISSGSWAVLAGDVMGIRMISTTSNLSGQSENRPFLRRRWRTGSRLRAGQPRQHVPAGELDRPRGRVLVLVAQPRIGGLYDGFGRRVVRFPKDGHPDMCYMATDVTSDCRDELIVWDPFAMWVDTQTDAPLPGMLYQPTRNPLHHLSNYGASGSFPPEKE